MTVIDVIKYIIAIRDERNQLIKCMKYNKFRKDSMNISNQGINLQRLKLNPDTIKFMCNDLVKLNYDKHNYERVRRLKGYYLLAIDSTDLLIPNNDEKQENTMVVKKNKNLEVTRTMASAIHPYKTSERLMAIENIKESIDIIQNKKIYVFDRN